MSNYDDILRDKDNGDHFNESSMEKHWAALEKKLNSPAQMPEPGYRKLFRPILAVAAVLVVILLGYMFFNNKQQEPGKANETTTARSAILPPLPGTNLPYEIFKFNAATGDTLFTLNGSIIIFPAHAVLNARGEAVTGNIEVRTREFNDPFDYSIAGIPMDYDSAGTNYLFISSAMIDISAYQDGELLRVNAAAKPQLNLVSTNKERNTNLYILDTVTGKWIYRGKDEVNLLQLNESDTINNPNTQPGNTSAGNFPEMDPAIIPAPPQKASDVNPVINVIIDPASFKELLVYNGLKFEVMDANADKVGEDSKMDWDNIELKRGKKAGSYKIIFSARNREAIYNVKPVLEGEDYQAAEKLYQQKLKEYTSLQHERKKSEKKIAHDNKQMLEENKRIDELNKLVAIRNKFAEAENAKIDAMNKEMERRRDSAKAIREQQSRLAELEQNLIRSFTIDSFGYWNCDMPTLPETIQYVSSFKTPKNEVVTYRTLCIAIAGINRIQNYKSKKTIDLVPNSNYYGWAFSATGVYYFTREDFKRAPIKKNPNTISIDMNLYQGDVKNYIELKGFIFNVNNNARVPGK